MSGRQRSSCCSGFCRFLRSELHYTKLCLGHDDWRAFAYTPWLPYTWKLQWIYLIYRWVIMLYFSGWFLDILILNSSGAKFLIFLTNWGFIFWIAYLLFAAISTTVRFFQANFCCKEHFNGFSTYPSLTENISSPTCCGRGNWLLTLNDKIHWVLFIIGGEFAVGITLLFWIALYDPSDPQPYLGVYSLHVHLLNGIISALDLFVTSIPVRLYHVLFTFLFSSAYVSFTGFYYLGNGTNPLNGESYIYPVLDYESHPGSAAAVAIGTAVLFVLVLHIGFYLIYLLRHWLAGLLHKHCYSSSYVVTGLDDGEDLESNFTEKNGLASSAELSERKYDAFRD